LRTTVPFNSAMSLPAIIIGKLMLLYCNIFSGTGADKTSYTNAILIADW